MNHKKKELSVEMAKDGFSGHHSMFIKMYEQEDIEMHEHNFFELAYITSGQTQHSLNQRVEELTEGDYFIIDYGTEHSYTHSKDLTLINCLFLPNAIDQTLVDCSSYDDFLHGCLLRYYKLYKGSSTANRIFKDQGGRVRQILTSMMDEYQQKKVGYEEILKNKLLEIIILTIRHIVERDLEKISGELSIKLIAHLKRHYDDKNALKKFYLEFHYSPQYVSRKFKEETGYTPNKFLQKIRVEKACELLAGSNEPVYAVAERIGLSDVKYFVKVFKKMIQMTPRQYRKLNE